MAVRQQSLAGIALGFVVLSLAFGLLERLWPALPGQPRLREGFRTDLAYWFFTPLVTRAISRAALIAGLLLIAVAAGVPLQKGAIKAFVETRRTWASTLPVGLQAVLVIVLGDLIGYWGHRLFHGRALWKYHAVHHASTRLDWLSSVRLHPVNDALERLLQVVPLFLLGFNLGVLAAYVPFLTLYAIFLHANVRWDFGPLRAAIATPRFHRWHHTSQREGLDKNFAGLLPLWDVLFGTYYMPAGLQPERFGVDGEPVPEGFLAQLAYPFRRA
jgi:sterol desaturase/sphingolipid hydroxylase (fatty acid hydroxylase superfamily)